jgi:hypothetical protein
VRTVDICAELDRKVRLELTRSALIVVPVLKGFVKDKIKLEAPDPKAAPDRLLVLSGPLNCRRLCDVKALPGP